MRYDDGIPPRTVEEVANERTAKILSIIRDQKIASINDPDKRRQMLSPTTAPKWKPIRQAVQCITYPDRVFPNADEAAKSVARTPSAIREAIRHGGRCGGLRWRFVGARRFNKRPDKERPIMLGGKIFADSKAIESGLGVSDRAIARGLERGFIMLCVPIQSVDPSKFPIEATDAA